MREKKLMIELRMFFQEMMLSTIEFALKLPTRMEYVLEQKLTQISIPVEDIPEEDAVCPISHHLYGTPGEDELPDYPVTVKCPGAHMFGQRAILQWLGTNATCPICRYEIMPKCSLPGSLASYVAVERRGTFGKLPLPEWVINFLGRELEYYPEEFSGLYEPCHLPFECENFVKIDVQL